jgi:Zn-dependent protease with chaperone function
MTDKKEISSKQVSVLHNLRPEEYEHPFDKQALNALEGTPGLEILIRKIFEYGIEKLVKMQYTGSNIKVTSKNLPDFDNLIKQVCRTIHLRDVPECYIQQGDDINAMTTGSEKPIIIFNHGAIDKLSHDELIFLIGHEIGHIKSQHSVYHLLGLVLPIIADMIVGIGGIISKGMEMALVNWQRKSEFTADRAGLLACQNIEAAITAMMKMAGAPSCSYDSLNPIDFLEQAKEFENFDIDQMNKFAKLVSAMGETHPWTVMRGAEMQKWIESGEYRQLIIKHSQIPPTDTDLSSNKDKHFIFCTNCGKEIRPASRFCIHCGSKTNRAD